MKHNGIKWGLAGGLIFGSLTTAVAQGLNGYTPPTGYTAQSLQLSGSSLAVSPNGLLAVGNDQFGGGASVSVYDRVGAGRTLLRQFNAPAGTRFQFLSGLTFGDSDTLYLAENGDTDTVYRASISTGTLTPIAPIGSVPDIAQITLRPSDGTLFAVTAGGSGTGNVYSLSGGTAHLFATGLGNGYLGGIGFAPDGSLWVGDSNDPNFTGNAGQLLRLDGSGHIAQTVSLAGGGGSGLYDFTFDSEGNILASTGGTLTKVRPGATPQVTSFGLFTGGFPFPSDVTFFGNGFRPFDGNGSLLVNGGFTDVGGLFLVQPVVVPEPSSALMLLSLIGATGLSLSRLRHRKRETGRWLLAGKGMGIVVLLLLPGVCSAQIATDFATTVLAYSSNGAPNGFTDPNKALGAPSTLATPSSPDNTAVVSLGTRGSITLGFGRPVPNNPYNPGGLDFTVFGNAFYVGGDIHKRFQEPGRVEVGVDVNGNGYDASDPFYLLKSSTANPAYGIGGVDDRNSTTWGYADVTPTDGQGDPLTPDDPYTSGISAGSAGGDAFDIGWAVDAQGNSITLSQINYVRITSASTSWSPELDAVSIVRPSVIQIPGRLPRRKEYVPVIAQRDNPLLPVRASAVPEPSSTLTMGTSLTGMVYLLWKVKRPAGV